ncbi:hypothetical protein OAU13_00030 [bacterium]|nr:hypothetical protein [bacterium]
MANVIKIKRSSSTAAPASLSEGELAFSYLSDKLYIGNSSAVIPIGGAHSPGTLTANQALVANSTSGIDKVITANLTTQEIWANGAAGTAGFVLLTGGAGGNVHWVDPSTLATAIGGANTQIQFNDSGDLGADADFTFDKDTSKLTVGNSTVNTAVTPTTITLGTVTVNTTAVFVGNSTVNAVLTSSSLDIDGTITSGNVSVNGYVNATSTISVGNEVVANSTALLIGNSTVNAVLTSSSLDIDGTITSGNVSVTGFVNATSTVQVGANVIANTSALFIGNSSVNAVLTSSSLDIDGTITSGNVSVTGFVNATSTVQVGANVIANTSALFIGNSTVNAVLTASSLDIDGTITAGNGAFVDMTVSGNLTVTGTLTTIDTVNLVVKDPLIKLANNNSSDAVDIGFYGVYNDGTAKYTALFRDRSDSGKFKLYTGLTNEPGTEVDLTGGALATFVVGTLEATSLTLSTPLGVASGGTGAGTFTAKGVIYGNGTSALQVTAAGTNGQVLQANSTGYPVWGDLDGGTF